MVIENEFKACKVRSVRSMNDSFWALAVDEFVNKKPHEGDVVGKGAIRATEFVC